MPAAFFGACRLALLDTQGDPALRAEVLTLPGESYLADQMAVVDVDGIHRARESLRRRIGEELASDLLRVYAAQAETGPYAFTPDGIGRRALKGLALGYLMAGGGTDALDPVPRPVHRRPQHDGRDGRAAAAGRPRRSRGRRGPGRVLSPLVRASPWSSTSGSASRPPAAGRIPWSRCWR